MSEPVLELAEEGPTLGPVEGIKRAVTTALKAGLSRDIQAPDPLHRVVNNVTMEYPMVKDSWPAVWVGFSIRKLAAPSINKDMIVFENNIYRLWSFEGTVNVTILALSSLERDRLADSFIRMYAFQELHPSQNAFWETIESQDYVYLYANKGELRPSGQSEGPGMAPPWDSSQLGYADSYSFDIGGQFASNTYTGNLVRLSEIRIIESLDPPQEDNGGWV